jgi:divalent metal cation (Fe/Co/Zn/Cd) transporter
MRQDSATDSLAIVMQTDKPAPGRVRDVDRALRLEWLTVGWMTIEAAASLVAGFAAHSLVLEAFGADSVIELVSAGVLIWRLRVELKSGDAFPESAEHRARRLAGGLLFVLSAYVLGDAIYALRMHEGQDFTVAGLLVTGAAIPVMYFLAKSKLRIAERIGSRALHADAVESMTCGYLSVVVVIALVAQLLLGAWWVSGVSALALVPFLLREGREAWGEDHCCER